MYALTSQCIQYANLMRRRLIYSPYTKTTILKTSILIIVILFVGLYFYTYTYIYWYFVVKFVVSSTTKKSVQSTNFKRYKIDFFKKLVGIWTGYVLK